MFDKILSILKEPSSYAGFGVISMAWFGWSAEQFGAIVAAIIAVSGLVAVFRPEKGGE